MEGEEFVRYLLKNYHQMKREVEGKKSLLMRLIYESEEEVIEGMNFKSFQGEKVTHSGRTDKTANIAIEYKEAFTNQELQEVQQLKKEIREKELNLFKLETAIEGLDDKLQRLIKGIYLERKSRIQICKELYISEGTLGRWSKKAVESISKWW